ncbi:WD40-repeat-containing domain protein [Endogone sp. FLAS-F59071]|nr:WD40-repeat-containing domain protein [Endogone sp. FLAS-F59071]|eukprot:RUS12807.1 WD40-repeat-containing domain protein [Endogone sp. FLAS-F59071]
MTLSLLTFPWDVLRSILPYLSLSDLRALLLTNTTLHALVQREGWRSFCRNQGWNSDDVLVHRIRCIRSAITASSSSKNHDDNDTTTITTDWNHVARVAHRLQHRWAEKQFTIATIPHRLFMPTVCFNRRTLVFNAGRRLDISHDWSVAGKQFHAQRHIEFDAHNGDITDVLLDQADTEAQTIWTCSVDSLIKRWELPNADYLPSQPTQTFYGHLSAVQSIHAHYTNPSVLASLGKDETLRLWNTTSSTPQYTHLLSRRSWTVRFINSTDLAIGASGALALSLYTVLPTGPEYVANLPVGASAVYGLHANAVTDHTLAAGCFDGLVRLYDLRTHQLVSTYQDPYDDAPVYSVSADRFHIAAGTAMHGVVRVWDARYKSDATRMGSVKNDGVRDGWSVYLGEVRSPVYSVQMDFGRLVGVTSSGVSILDFTSSAGAEANFRGRGDRNELERNTVNRYPRNPRYQHPVNRGRSHRQQLSRLAGKRIFYNHADSSTFIGE